jgi:hypothetical protein
MHCYLSRVAELVMRTAPTLELQMQVIEITDLVEARRARLAQYHGLPRTLQLNGQTVTGSVKSVVMDVAAAKWTVKFVTTPPVIDKKYNLRRSA